VLSIHDLEETMIPTVDDDVNVELEDELGVEIQHPGEPVESLTRMNQMDPRKSKDRPIARTKTANLLLVLSPSPSNRE
jgi:hypothetical protein